MKTAQCACGYTASGETDAAIECLLRAEETAIARDSLAHLSRIRRSLRLAGVGRTARRGGEGMLTAREAEVLGLVAEGLTNDEIARRLGIGRPTVVRLVQTASAKLGARSRAHAAARAARR